MTLVWMFPGPSSRYPGMIGKLADSDPAEHIYGGGQQNGFMLTMLVPFNLLMAAGMWGYRREDS